VGQAFQPASSPDFPVRRRGDWSFLDLLVANRQTKVSLIRFLDISSATAGVSIWKSKYSADLGDSHFGRRDLLFVKIARNFTAFSQILHLG
jgi:hypothetical protein